MQQQQRLNSKLQSWTMIAPMVLLVFILCISSHLLTMGQTVTYPPQPNPGYGRPYNQIWGPGTTTSPGANPLNTVGANADGTGGTQGCLNTGVQSGYTFNVLENYQQLLTFYPSTCNNLKVRINSLPSSSVGILYQYSTANGRSYPITTTPFDLTSNMVLFQPTLNVFSIYDFPRTPVVNSSATQLVFQLVDTGSSIALPTNTNPTVAGNPTGSQIQFWILWQNQPPTCTDITVPDILQGDPGWNNQIIDLLVDDPDVSGTTSISQILTAYITSVPTAGNLYQYDSTSPPLYRGALISGAQTPVTVTDPAAGHYRVVLESFSTGRPYTTFTYSADDTFVDNIVNGVVTVNILYNDFPLAVDWTYTLDMNSMILFQLNASSSPATLALNRGTVTSLPAKGSIFQVQGGTIGSRISVVPTAVLDPNRYLYFKPDPYDSNIPYTSFQFYVGNGLHDSGTGTVTFNVNLIHISPQAQDQLYLSPSGSDVAIRFIGSTKQPGITSDSLTAVVTSLPANGTLYQSNGVQITAGGLPVTVTDITNTIVYRPQPNLANPSLPLRYTATFTYEMNDNSGDPLALSANAQVKIQVGSIIRPPTIYAQNFTTLQNTTIVIQLSGTIVDDTWSAIISRVPTYGKLYQMVNAQKGSQILIDPNNPVPVTVNDPNYYLFYEPDRFNTLVDTFDWYGQNSEQIASTSVTGSVYVTPVPFAPTVPATSSVTTPASTAVVVTCSFYAGPTPPPTVGVYITTLPTAGTLYQYNSTSGLQVGTGITVTMLTISQGIGLPGVQITDPLFQVLYVPPPYVHGPAAQNYLFTQFVYIAKDSASGLLSPASSTVSVAVTQVNFPPIIVDGTEATLQETAVTISLAKYVTNPSAADGNTYICIISQLPTSGALYQVDSTGKPASQPIPVPNVIVSDPQYRVIYKPRSGTGQFGIGYDTFKFFAEDPTHFVKSTRFAQISIDVAFVNKPPKAPAFDAWMYENQGKIIQLPAVDPEGSPCTTYITAMNLPYGQLFQYVDVGGSLAGVTASLAVGGDIKDPEYGHGDTYLNYTGQYGGGFDHTPYLGKPITTFPVAVTDPSNRVVFLTTPYTHGNAAYQSLYGIVTIPGSGTFQYIANDGLDNTTSPGVVSVRVKTQAYAPIALDQTWNCIEDTFVVIKLNISKFDVDENPPCYIQTIPTIGNLFQYDGRNPTSPKAEQILSAFTQVQDINTDGTPGVGVYVVYEPPKLQFGDSFANFTFYSRNTLQGPPGNVVINVKQKGHEPQISSFAVILGGHNSTTPVTFNVTNVDFDAVYVNITSFPAKGQLYSQYDTIIDDSPSGYNYWTGVPGTILSPSSPTYYPPAPYYNTTNRTTIQTFSILFDDFSMGGGAVTTGCVVSGTTVPCGYTNFTYRVFGEHGLFTDGFVQVQIQCGPSYVVNIWERDAHACVSCPIGAICASEGQFLPMAEKGYFRGLTPNGLMFVACLPSEACLGTTNSSALVSDTDSQCAPGYHGRMCAACQADYYKLNDKCSKCSGTDVFWIVLAGVPSIIIAMWFILHVSRRGVDLTFFAIVLTYCQILAIYAQYHLTWHDSVLTALTVFSITHLNLDIFAVSCYYNTGDYSDKWKAKMAVIPGLALGVIAMVALLFAMRALCGKYLNKLDARAKRDELHAVEELEADLADDELIDERPGMNRMLSSGLANYQRAEKERHHLETQLHVADHRTGMNNDPSAGFNENTPLKTWMTYYGSLGVRTFSLFLFIAYLPICAKIFQLFNCTSFPDGTSTFDADWSLTCYDSWWYQLRPYGIVAIIIYGFGIPTWFFFGLYKTAPKFDMVCWWFIFYYPKVRSVQNPLLSSKKGKRVSTSSDRYAATTADEGAILKKPPPPPNSPPQIPAPEKESHVPHLHAATVKALEQARAGQSVEDLSARKSKFEEDDATQKAKREAAWQRSDNLALTSAESNVLTEQQKIARFMFTLVIDPFRDDLFFWMFVILLRSFLLAMVSIFFADEPVYQATLALLVLFLYTLGTAYFQPYVNPSMNKLEFMCMSCACLVLFSGFLFIGESQKSGSIFDLLAAVCLIIIIVSFLFIGKVIFAKLEENFHCWNCRRVPTVAAPPVTSMNQIAKSMRTEIIAGHNSGASSQRKAATGRPGMSVQTTPRDASRIGKDLASPSFVSPQPAFDLASPSMMGPQPILPFGGSLNEQDRLSSPSPRIMSPSGTGSSSSRPGGVKVLGNSGSREGPKTSSKSGEQIEGRPGSARK